jgi:hypothetical protein
MKPKIKPAPPIKLPDPGRREDKVKPRPPWKKDDAPTTS